MSRRFCFRKHFYSQRVYSSQTILKSARQHFYAIVLSSSKNSFGRFLLAWFEILGLFVNTLTADDKYYCHNREKYPQAIQIIWKI